MSRMHHLTDIMPDVAHGHREWTAAERSHLAGCAECLREWEIVAGARGAVASRAGGPVAGKAIDAEAVARRVLIRLRNRRDTGQARPSPRPRALRWVSGLAAAAALVFALGTGELALPSGPTVAAPVLLPELSDLSYSELETVLAELPATQTTTSSSLPLGHGLSDLSEEELERVLSSLEG